MKRAIKWFVVLGIVSCLLGIGVITAGAVMGGGQELESYLVSDGFPIGRVGYEYRPGTDGYMAPGGEAPYNADKSMGAVNYRDVKTLKLEAGPGEVTILTEDREDPADTDIRVEGFAIDGVLTYSYDVRQEGSELKIGRSSRWHGRRAGHFDDAYGHDSHGWERGGDYHSERMENLVIYIPRDYRFHEVEIEVSAASVTADGLNADELDLEVMAGETVIGGSSFGKTDVECMAGSVDLTLEGRKEDYDYDLSAKTGSITLTGEDTEVYTSLWQEKHIDYQAGRKVELDCTAGEITIRYPQPGL